MDEVRQLRIELHRLTTELVGNCAYCLMISPDVDNSKPIYCTKLIGAMNPSTVDVSTCLSCREYKSLATG